MLGATGGSSSRGAGTGGGLRLASLFQRLGIGFRRQGSRGEMLAPVGFTNAIVPDRSFVEEQGKIRYPGSLRVRNGLPALTSHNSGFGKGA
jgi:hypothetical protein